MAEQISTKDRYVFEALKLFGEKGYSAVKLADIAHQVGCTTSALYKHYENKQELYDAILVEGKRRFDLAMDRFRIDFSQCLGSREEFVTQIRDQQLNSAKGFVQFALHDEWTCAFRKLMMVEQFNNRELARLYDTQYIDLQYVQYGALFQILMQGGYMKKADPQTLAVAYVAPIILMIGVCDRQPEKEGWAMRSIENHIRDFNQNYML